MFSRLINTGSYEQVFLALGLGAVMMILGGVAELLFGVKAERQSLEQHRQAAHGGGLAGCPPRAGGGGLKIEPLERRVQRFLPSTARCSCDLLIRERPLTPRLRASW